MSFKTAVVWFRNDLRVHDNPVLDLALMEAEEVIPLYVFNPKMWEKDEFGHVKTGSFRTRFILESVDSLRTELRKRGSELIVATGDPAGVINRVAEQYGARKMYASKEFTREEEKLEDRILKHVPVHSKFMYSSFLYHPDDVSFKMRDLPDVFTSFRKLCENKSDVREVVPPPDEIKTPPISSQGEIPDYETLGVEMPLTDDRSVLPFNGGETTALQRIDHYIWDAKAVKKFNKTRDGLIGPNYSTKFSPWLAAGCVSPLFIRQEINDFEREVKKNKSTYWVKFELIWRDFYRYLALKYGDSIFRGHYGSDQKREMNEELFEKWKHGKTGVPFVDANMRELLHTGYMSSRGRKNTASYLVNDLKQDWRAGASWFQSQLIDYDTYSNWGNWAHIAGVGNDPKKQRPLDVQKEAALYDPLAEYIKLWIPELKNVDLETIMTWNELSPAKREKAAPAYMQSLKYGEEKLDNPVPG